MCRTGLHFSGFQYEMAWEILFVVVACRLLTKNCQKKIDVETSRKLDRPLKLIRKFDRLAFKN